MLLYSCIIASNTAAADSHSGVSTGVLQLLLPSLVSYLAISTAQESTLNICQYCSICIHQKNISSICIVELPLDFSFSDSHVLDHMGQWHSTLPRSSINAFSSSHIFSSKTLPENEEVTN